VYRDEDEESRAYNVTRTTKTVEGLHFLVEEDRPIEKIAGVYRPIDLDSYIALKFGILQKKIDELAAAMQRKMYELGQRLDALDKRVDELAAPPPAQPQPVMPQNVTTNQTATTQ